MIHRFSSSLTSFKSVEFNPGLNIVLADRNPASTDRETRNGAGKSSLVELVHFLLGANCKPDSIFRNPTLIGSWFEMEFDIAGVVSSVRRSGEKPNIFTVAFTKPLETQPDFVGVNGRFNLTKWREFLGASMFGLPQDGEDSKWLPTFRQLFGYFARRQSSGAFTSPFKQAVEQSLGDQQIALTYLLGLDWSVARDWQLVRERERTLVELRKAAAQGVFGSVIGSAADLRTRLAVSEERTRNLRESVATYRVHDEYPILEREAAEISARLAELSDRNTIDRGLLAELESSIADEAEPPVDDVRSMFEEAGLVLPDRVVRRFDEVVDFHRSVVANRKAYLDTEIQQLRTNLQDRLAEMSQLDDRRAQLMAILRSHGALDQFVRLQSELGRLEAETETIRQQLASAEQLEGTKLDLDIERNRLQMRLIQDFKERSTIIGEAIVAFEDVSSALYERAGSLTIIESMNGPQFEVRIQGQKSKGISNMQVFCFDMMLMRLSSERNSGPGFLIHDSHLFDGVDERQIAHALEIGADLADKYNFQYIVTMNSDTLPINAFQPDFDVQQYVLPVKLDDTDTGGLFGVRFG